MHGIRLSHICEITSISNEKPSISIKIPSISKYQVFRIRNFEILGFPYLEFEILGISSKIATISKRCEIPGFQWIVCISSSIGFHIIIRILINRFVSQLQSNYLQQTKTIKGHNNLLGTGYLVEIPSFRNTRYFTRNTQYFEFKV